MNDEFVFIIKYNSKMTMNYAFFNPPDGDKLMQAVSDGIISGNNTVTISVNKDLVLNVPTITIKFYVQSGGDFIYFSTDQLKSLP